MLRAVVGLALGLITRVWLSTLRVDAVVHPSLSRFGDVPWVLALWHGQVFPLLAYRRRRRTVAMVSKSRDGEFLAWAFRWLGVAAVRGSSSRGGRNALTTMVEWMGNGWDSAFAVDGPKGPWHVPRPGALWAASRSGGIVVPFVAACKSCLVLRRSWDRFELPRPFSRIVVVLGPPLLPELAQGEVGITSLANALDDASCCARRVLGSRSETKVRASLAAKEIL